MHCCKIKVAVDDQVCLGFVVGWWTRLKISNDKEIDTYINYRMRNDEK